MATVETEVASRSIGLVQRWRRLAIPLIAAGLPLALAVAGAILTPNAGGIGGLNLLVEGLSGRSGSLLGSAWSIIPLGFAFGAGMVSSVNPCGFAMLLAYLGLYLGAGEKAGLRTSPAQRLVRALMVGGSVAVGFILLFSLAGVAIGGGARAVVNIIPWLGLAIGVLLVIAGAWLLGGGKLYSGFAAQAASRVGSPGQIGTRGYFFFGISYGTASLNCTLPIFLAVVGSSLAVDGLLAALGQFVLYALGMGLVIMFLTLALALFKGATVGALRKALPYVQPVSAGLMILAGSYIAFYWLTIGGLLAKIA
jgi:cytochrome c biogenesis protein CcdA